MRNHQARFIAGASQAWQLPQVDAPQVAFAGRSNVGKSSLINRLVGHRKLARVSKTPGRTQQINFFAVDERIVFVDLPGYGFARVPLSVKEQWKVLVESYLSKAPGPRAVIVIVDLRRGVQSDDAQLVGFLTNHGIPTRLVATKSDKVKRSERRALVAAIAAAATSDVPPFVCSSESGEGVPELWEQIERDCAGRGA